MEFVTFEDVWVFIWADSILIGWYSDIVFDLYVLDTHSKCMGGTQLHETYQKLQSQHVDRVKASLQVGVGRHMEGW
jgi:hypothetical protein